jgi:hypothetical protein
MYVGERAIIGASHIYGTAIAEKVNGITEWIPGK